MVDFVGSVDEIMAVNYCRINLGAYQNRCNNEKYLKSVRETSNIKWSCLLEQCRERHNTYNKRASTSSRRIRRITNTFKMLGD